MFVRLKVGAIDYRAVRHTCLASSPRKRDSRPVSKRALAHLRADPAMARLIDRVGPVKLRPRRLPPFQSLTHAVIHQQLSGQAAGTILGRFRALFGDDSFPTPEAVLKASPERLRSAGLSRPKASYVLGIAQKAVDGHIPTLDDCDRMTDAEIVERLTSIKGVGRWTAEMLLIFNLGRRRRSAGRRLGCQEGLPVRLRQAEAAGAGATRPLRRSMGTAPHSRSVVFVEGRRFLGWEGW